MASQIVGVYGGAQGKVHAFMEKGGVYTTIDDPLGTGGTWAQAVNDLGQVVGYYFDAGSHRHGFIYDSNSGTYTAYDNPLGTNGTALTGINDSGQLVGWYQDSGGHIHGFVATPAPNPPPAAGTTADMILRGANTSSVAGQYEIYDIGNNAILAGYSLGQVGTTWNFVTLAGFFGNDTTDMLLRNSTTGGFEVYDISNNNITNAAFLGAIGLDWQVMGFGNFGSFGETDMLMRNMNTGAVQVYDIRNNQIIGSNPMGMIGLDWQAGGQVVGNFSSRGTSDIILRNKNTGGLEVYDINSNQITGAAFMGTVGLDWQIVGSGNFSSNPGESDLMMRNINTGAFEIYDIANNQITSAFPLGVVGLDWQVAGFGPISGAGRSDMVLRNVNTGAFQVYDVANNQLTAASALGSVGLDWQLGGFAADPPAASMAASDSSNAQLIQAMAGFGGASGATENLNTAMLGADASQQTLLTSPRA
jgi:probable HAF family extracellular repeat protein